MSDRLFDQLLPLSFRGVIVPCSHIRVHISHDLAQHKHPDQNGARVENTGLNPLTFEASLPLYERVAPGASEAWANAYPTQHGAFMAAMKLTTTGILQHPSLGQFFVKPSTMDSTLDAGRQDGEAVTASWVETIETDPVLAGSISTYSPISEATLAAIDLDTQLSQTNFGGFDPDDGKITFEEAMRRVAGAISKAQVLSKQYFGIIDRVVYRINAIRDAVVASQDPQNWPLKESLSRLLASTNAVKKTALAAQKDVRVFITPRPMSLTDIAMKFKNLIGDIIRLNPSLVSAPVVPERTVVRYYAIVGVA